MNMDHRDVESAAAVFLAHLRFDSCYCPFSVPEEELFLAFEVGEAVIVEEGFVKSAEMFCVEYQEHGALSFLVSHVGELEGLFLNTGGRSESREFEALARFLVVAVDLYRRFGQS